MAKNKVITGASALYIYKLIDYKPDSLTITMITGTNPSHYKESVSTQNNKTIIIGSLPYDDNYDIYKPERLFIELELYPLETTIKNTAIRNLEEMINPHQVYDIYTKLLKDHRRGLNKERIEEYLNKHTLRVKEAIESNPNKTDSVLREYIIALMSKSNIPVSLVKGGSAVELYVDFKRSTADIDAHVDKSSINELIKIVEDKNNLIYFIPKNLNSFIEKVNSGKKIFELVLEARSNKRLVNNLLKQGPKGNIEIKLNINTTYSNQELKDIISDYQVTKRELNFIKNGFGFIFTPEMLLAEKYQSLISKNENSTRTKDLIDLINIYKNNDIDIKKFSKWFFRKWSHDSKNPLTIEQSIKFIVLNKDKPLTKIEENFIDATKMYETSCTFQEGLDIYNQLSEQLITLNKHKR